MRRLVFAAGLLLPMLVSSAAWAQAASSDAEAQARTLYANGVTLYEEGSYEQAIVAFQKAYQLSNRHALLYNIANAQERLGRTQDAIDTLNSYRIYAMPDERESLERRLRAMERRLDEEKAAAKAKADAEAAAAAAANANKPPPQQVPPPQQNPPPPTGVRLLPVTLFVTGAAGIGIGTGFGIRANGARSEADEFCNEGAGGAVFCTADAADALARDKGSSLAADISFGLGGVALISGLVVTLVDADLPVHPAFQLQIGPGAVGVGGAF